MIDYNEPENSSAPASPASAARSLGLAVLLVGGIVGGLPPSIALAQDNSATSVRAPQFAVPPALDEGGKARLFVLSDIGNEPDDQMSFVRLLLYANEIDIEGIVATTSTFQRDKTNPDTFREIVADYAKVRPNLLLHASGWPTAGELQARISAGQPGYGLSSTGAGRSTAGSRALIAAVDKADDRPLWVSVWGGSNTLAQALIDVRRERSSAEVDAFVSKLRIYSISDQDDAGPWIRKEFPELFYVVSPSSPGASQFASATWTGIAGDIYYRNGAGADFSKVTNEWLDTHIRAKGPLGAHYPRYEFIMEGDTPSFLNLIRNGLEAQRSPSWGGWGGRYNFIQPYGEERPIWTQGGDAFFHIDSRDAVIGTDGQVHVSDQATIWRWRNAFQNDFAARMNWTIKRPGEVNRSPKARIEGKDSLEPLRITMREGESLALDAGASLDPDGDALAFEWFSYPEAGMMPGRPQAYVEVSDARSQSGTITATAACRPLWLPVLPENCTGTAHVILAVTDTGTPPLTSYRRVIVTVSPAGD